MLGLYEKSTASGDYIPFSFNDDISNVIKESFNSSTGAIKERQFFIRNDDANVSYSSITLTPLPNELVNVSADINIKLKLGDMRPSQDEWSNVVAGASLSIPDISDTLYHSFWVRIEVRQNAAIRVEDDIYFELRAIEA